MDCKPGSVPTPGCPRAAKIIPLGRRVAASARALSPGHRSGREAGRSSGPLSSVSLFELAPGRACLAAGHPAVARGLLPHDFTLTVRGLPLAIGGVDFCCAFPRVTPGRCYRPPCPVEPGLSSRERCVFTGDLPATSGGRIQSLRRNGRVGSGRRSSRPSIPADLIDGLLVRHEPSPVAVLPRGRLSLADHADPGPKGSVSPRSLDR